MKAYWCWLLSGVLAVSVVNCHSTKDITSATQLQRWSGTLLVFARDSSLYRISNGTVTDTLIVGLGTVERGDRVAPFKGTIPLSDVRYLQLRYGSFFRTVLAIGATAFVASSLIEALGNYGTLGSAGVDAYYYRSYGGGGGGGGGSCPVLTAWNGDEFRLQGEAFSVAWGSALEYASTHMLPDLADEGGLLTTRIVNNRAETHYINSVRLLAIPAQKGGEVCVDTDGRFWPLREIEPPLVAVDHAGTDAVTRLSAGDGVRWRSDLRPSEDGGGFEDTLVTTFDRGSDSRQVSFYIRAINTRISAAVFAWAGRLLGDQSVRFVDRIEHDPGFAALLKEWMLSASLRVDVWNGSTWEEAGRILPEANEVHFSRIVRLALPASAGKRVTIRLRTLCDVWEIDRVGLDCSPSAQLPATELPLVSAIDDRGEDRSGAIAGDDGLYAVTLPPQHITMMHAAPDAQPGMEWKYAMQVGGYLHEWLPDGGEGSPLSMLTGDARVEAVRLLLMNPQLVLPPIYASWREARER